MPEEIEVPTEHLHESMEEAAKEEGGGFTMQVALSSALVAVLAAICALFAGGYANEAMMKQLQSSDQWAFFQAKSIKAEILDSKMELLRAAGHKAKQEDVDKAAKYEKDKEDITDKAKELGEESETLLAKHELLSKGVTFFQVAIALGAISVLTRKRRLWVLSLVTSLGGVYFLAAGLFFK